MDPRIARFGWFEYRYYRGHLQWRIVPLPGEQPNPWQTDGRSPEEYAAVAELRNHPTEDEEGAAA